MTCWRIPGWLICAGVFCLRPVAYGGVDTASIPLSPSDSLSKYVRDSRPWVRLPANSEQRQPLYFGATPREIALKLQPVDGGRLLLVDTLRPCFEAQARELRRILFGQKKIASDAAVEFEAWPVRDDLGEPNWAFARWRTKGKGSWQWLDAAMRPAMPGRTPFLPVLLDLTSKQDFASVFDDMLECKDLYDKPLFGDCIWTDPDRDGTVTSAWEPVTGRESRRKQFLRRLEKGEKVPGCRLLPQPARWNGHPVTFQIPVDRSGAKWPGEIAWKAPRTQLVTAGNTSCRIPAWPQDFQDAYRRDILALDGEREAIFPLSSRKVRFTRKNSVDTRNQLFDLVGFLEERYRQLGIRTRRQEFVWRGIPQANLIAVIPGSGKDSSLRPVVMADHYDTAFCDEVFAKNKRRVSAPGADDNLSATGALLRAAEILRHKKPVNDVWLVHLTGEEFPADDLGARHFVGKLLRDRQDLSGLVLMDMIGHRESTTDRIFQVNTGDDAASLRMAKIAIDSSSGITRFQPVLRTRYDPRSYLYNTDGLIFADAGYPVVYFNEHLNRLENFFRKGYHHMSDTSGKMDWKYAADISKVAIQTAVAMAGEAADDR